MSDSPPYRLLGTPRAGGILCVLDHASNHVPPGLDLGIDPGLMQDHIAWDIGTAAVAEILHREHGIPAHLATVSRLVCDLNREEHDPAAIPERSDGHAIPGNIGIDREARLAAYHRPYHAALAGSIAAARPALIAALHSFTPALRSCDKPRPWQVALLHNRDDRAARIAIRLFAEHGLTVGDNEPYSGRDLNATMDRHAEAHGIPYCAIEIRQDQIAGLDGQARWAALLGQVLPRVAAEVEAAQ